MRAPAYESMQVEKKKVKKKKNVSQYITQHFAHTGHIVQDKEKL